MRRPARVKPFFLVDDYQPQVPGIGLVGVDPAGTGPTPIPCVIAVAVTDSAGRQPANSSITWYDSQGGAIGQGSQLDLRTLGMGKHVVRAVVRGMGPLTARSWLIERTAAGCLLLSTICDPPAKGIPDPRPHPHPAPPPCNN